MPEGVVRNGGSGQKKPLEPTPAEVKPSEPTRPAEKPSAKRTHEFNGRVIDVDSCPVKIPKNANVIEQAKTGYDQVKYTWEENGVKYEARWHSKTPGAPIGQGDTWVVTKTTPGSPTGLRKKQEILTGENEWTSAKDWQDAVTARQNGTATPRQKEILDKGHWPAE